ncbi:unnamed protein product [Ectocarpus sp. 13 AM-2016]
MPSVRARVESTSEIGAQTCRKRGWKVNGQLAGEWRDRTGRHRRARPTESENKNSRAFATSAADISTVSSFPGLSSCAGTDVSFEGLVDELRERLPQASLLAEFVATERQNGCTVCPEAEAVMPRTTATSGRLHAQASRKRVGGERGEGNVGNFSQLAAGGGEPWAPASVPDKVAAARIGLSTSDIELQRERAVAAGVMPPGCLRLRHPMIGTMRGSPNPQLLVRSVPTGSNSSGNNSRLRGVVGERPRPSLVLPPRGKLFPDGSAYRLVTTGSSAGATESNTSPSAAMVAAAKAHERALPLLQVCAVKVIEPTGC